MKLTAIGSGYYRVFKDGVEFSKHTSEREALESAFNLESANPTANVTYKHDYEVKVEIIVAVPTPTPTFATVAFRLYSPDSIWNKKLTTEAAHPNSAALAIEMHENMKIAGGWVATNQYSHPIYYVDKNTPKVPVYLLQEPAGQVAQEILSGVPIPPSVMIASGTDGHLCIIDKDADKEYDFYKMKFNTTTNRWEAKTCGILPNVSNSDGTLKRLSVWNSATASHIPLAAGVITLKELETGVIPHALFIAINRPKNGWQSFVYPAKSTDGWYTGPNPIEEGRRFRFPANITIDPAWTPLVKMIVTAVRDYGMIVGDKTGAGVSFYVEDPTQYGKDQTVIDPYLSGKKLWNAFGSASIPNPEFPWLQLEALA